MMNYLLHIVSFSILAGNALSEANIPFIGNDRIEWHNWESESFEKASQENKMILVDVGMEGCMR